MPCTVKLAMQNSSRPKFTARIVMWEALFSYRYSRNEETSSMPSSNLHFSVFLYFMMACLRSNLHPLIYLNTRMSCKISLGAQHFRLNACHCLMRCSAAPFRRFILYASNASISCRALYFKNRMAFSRRILFSSAQALFKSLSLSVSDNVKYLKSCSSTMRIS